MKASRNWFNKVRRKFLIRSSSRDIVVLRSNACSSTEDDAMAIEYGDQIASYQIFNNQILRPLEEFTQEDMAAITIQATFRGHLARRAFRALRSLVKLQALARGAYVRKQSRIALHCMHALVRLQVRVRARQLLSQCSDK
ncbi:hypothetical protein Tsubulata_004919 [Turnera subulata]|uniref:DUF4005 domain-containing protein n=1 Tax=Turnera subulata TaxID=218843 RepID=A0A9Q0G148_9ROSI|nr:hypothetical protein Tsubulata_004919 [Turnera subulata]